MDDKNNFTGLSQQCLSEAKKKNIKRTAVIALIVCLFVACGVLAILFFQSKKNAGKSDRSATVHIVPTSISGYDYISDRDENKRTADYIILTTDTGKIKVTSDNNAYLVDDNGSYIGLLSDSEKKKALEMAELEGFYPQQDNTKQTSGDSYTYAYRYSSPDGNKNSFLKIDFSTKDGQQLQQTLEKKGLSLDGVLSAINDQLAAYGYSIDDLQNLAQSQGRTVEDIINEILNSSSGTNPIADIANDIRQMNSSSQGYQGSQGYQSNPNAPIGVEVSHIGSSANPETDQSTDTVVSTITNGGNNGEWLSAMPEQIDTNANMTALLNALGQLGGGSNAATEQTAVADARSAWMQESQSAQGVSMGARLTIWDLAAGTIVPITLVTAVDSDQPGNIVGLVRQDVYDTLTGSNIVIPKGSRVVATYNNGITFGQSSLQIAWTSLITPDGYTYTLPGFAGVSGEGFSGVKGKVNNHFWSILGASVLGSIIDYGGSTLQSVITNTAPQVVNNSLAAELIAALAGGSVSSVQSVGQQYVQRAASQAPTIRIKNGTLTQMLVNQTVSFQR